MFWLHVMVEFTKLNPIGYVPVLVHGDMVLADSFAIIMVYYYHFQE
jgi:glutathione S-transferase